MKKYKIDVFKVGDIEYSDLSPQLLTFIQNGAVITYEDKVLKEHIYNIDDTIEEIEQGTCECSDEIKSELNQLVTALHKKSSGYLRITY